jgi:hypothetical protein
MLSRARLRCAPRFLLKFEDSDAVRMRRFENSMNGGFGFFIENREIHFNPRFRPRGVFVSPLMAVTAAGALLGQVESENTQLPQAVVKIVQERTRDNGLYSFHITLLLGVTSFP